MRHFFGKAVGKTRAFLGNAYHHARAAHKKVSLGLKVASKLRPIMDAVGPKGKHISSLVGEADTKYHRIAGKVQAIHNDARQLMN